MARRLFIIPGTCLLVFFFLPAAPLFAKDGDRRDALALFALTLTEISTGYVDDIDTEVLIRHVIDGMTDGLDVYTRLLRPDQFSALKDRIGAGDGSIGLTITRRDGRLVVTAVADGSPADRSGIRPGDVLTAVNGISVSEKEAAPLAARFRGPEGSVIRLSVIPAEETDPVSYTLTRERVRKQGCRSAVHPGGVGYVSIPVFRDGIAAELADILDGLAASENGLTGLVLDLRDNPGGPLDQAVAVADLFLDTGTIVSISGRTAPYNRVFSAFPDPMDHTCPMAVLVNENSASSAELLAAALQDNGRATLIGTRSLGKGSIQAVLPLADGFALQYTVARYHTPKGRIFQGQGVIPDIYVDAVPRDDAPLRRALAVLAD